MNRRRVAIASATVALLTASYSIGARLGRSETTIDPRIKTLSNFCANTWRAMQEDAADFLSSDPAKQELALSRFYDSSVMYHNASSILMCTERRLNFPSMCWLNKKMECLGGAAERFADLLRPV